MNILPFLSAALLSFWPTLAHAEAKDSTAIHPLTIPYDSSTTFRSASIPFPATLIGIGLISINSRLGRTRADAATYGFDDYIQYVPSAAYLGLGWIPGVKHRHRFGERVLAGATAFACSSVLTQGLKAIVNEPRPDTGTPNSFPSGHTATAFMGAELCRIEYGNGYGAAAYTFALTTAAMRIVNRRHWANDVVAGAGIGILSAHVGYWLLPYEVQALHYLFPRWQAVNPAQPAMAFTPTYDPYSNSASVTFNMVF